MKLKRIISVILCLCIIAGLTGVAASGESRQLDPDTAVVMIPGLSMNTVAVYDGDGNKLLDSKLEYDLSGIGSCIPGLAVSLLMTSIFNMDIGLSGIIAGTVGKLLPGFNKNNRAVPARMDKPLSEYSTSDYRAFSQYVNLSGMGDMLTQTYLYNYDDFGSIREAADGLNDYINDVVLSKGYRSIVLCPVSLGGCVAAEYLDLYPESHAYIKKVVFMVAATCGADSIGELMTKDLTIIESPEKAIDTIISLLDEYGADVNTNLVRILLKLLINRRSFDTIVDSVIFGINDSVASTALWALCPDAYYAEARANFLMRKRDDAKRAEIDRFMQARANLHENLEDIRAGGGRVYVLSGYGRQLDLFCDPAWFGSAEFVSSDSIVTAAATSFGATVADYGETLPEDYTPASPVCSDPSHDHISPDRRVDASTCMYPETTWFFYMVSHAGFGSNYKTLALIKLLISDNAPEDVYSDPAFPQFMNPYNYP